MKTVSIIFKSDRNHYDKMLFYWELLSYIVPGSPPVNLNITVINSSTLLLSWSQPSIPNGIIINYTINCTGENKKNHIVVISTTMILVRDLSPYTYYACSVFGHTRVGMGPPITDVELTDEDSKYYISL